MPSPIFTPQKPLRIGQIVPSSNTTMETEIPAMFRARELDFAERFTFHSSRMRMKKVVKEELEAMDRDSDRCAIELSDARVDVLGYACLVAIMSMGKGYHRVSEARLTQRTVENGNPAPVVTSAGALVDGLKAMGAKRVSVVCPYMKPLTRMVVDYIESEDIEVKDYCALEIPDNLQVAAQDPANLLEIYKRIDTTASMPSCCRPACRCSRCRRSRRCRKSRASRPCRPRWPPRGRCSASSACARKCRAAVSC